MRVVHPYQLEQNPSIEITLNKPQYTLHLPNMPEYRQQDFADEVHIVADSYGYLPLSHTPMDEATRMKPTPDTILAMVIDALVKSRPVSHQLAQSTVAGLVVDRYHNIDKLSATTWEERSDLLRQVGYNRYREQCATNLGGISEFVIEKYGMKLLAEDCSSSGRLSNTDYEI